MLTITRDINVYAQGQKPIVQLSQYDDDFRLVFRLYTSNGTFTMPDGTTAQIQGTKTDGNGYSAAASVSGNTVTVAGHVQMTAAAGPNVFEIVTFYNNKRLSTINFILAVERAALDSDTVSSESVIKDLSNIPAAVEQAEAAADRAEEAARTLTIDPTLTQSGQAADAKVTGDEIDGLKEDLGQYANYLFEYGNINISNSGWIYTDETWRIRTKANTSLHLKAGVTVGLRNYTGNVYYVGWKKTDGTYDYHDEWLSEDFVTPVEGDYVFIIRYYTERYISNVSDLASLFFGYSISDYINEHIAGTIDQYRNVSFEKFNGFISATGDISAQTSDKEIYTAKLPCGIGDIFNIDIRYSSSHALWLAYGLYDWNGNFISRTVITPYNYGLGANYDVVINNQNAKYISFTYRTFNDSITTIKANSILSIAINSNLVLSDVVQVHASDINTNIKGINHRGYISAPENTLPAYKMSKKNGFQFVETDVSFTSDNVPVLLHDTTINRTARNADGTEISETININDITYTQALTYDFGIYKGEEYAGTKIPTFTEFITLCKKIGLRPYIELKEGTQAQIESLFDIVNACGMTDKVTWISFYSDFLAYVKNVSSYARLGLIVNSIDSSVITASQNLKTINNEVFIDTASYTASEVTLCKEAFIPLEIWTINNSSTIQTIDAYITGVTSDNLIAGYELYKANIN